METVIVSIFLFEAFMTPLQKPYLVSGAKEAL
jgi:hypothetical protein